MQEQGTKKPRVFKKFSYRGVDLDKLLEMSHSDVIELLPARLRRRFDRGLTRKYTTLLKKLRKAVSICCLPFCMHCSHLTCLEFAEEGSEDERQACNYQDSPA